MNEKEPGKKGDNEPKAPVPSVIKTKAILIEKIGQASARISLLNWGDNEDECVGFATLKMPPQTMIPAIHQHFEEERQKSPSAQPRTVPRTERN